MLVKTIHAGGFSSNVYVVEGEMFVDVGMDGNVLLSYPNINKVVLTHAHFDHTGAIESIKDAVIMVGREEVKNFSDALISVSVLFGFIPPKIEPDVLLDDGDTIELTDYELRVLHTPGHTPGSICLFEEGEGVLFSGDVVFANGGFGRCDLPGGDPTAMLKSLERLSKLDVDIMYPGHGDPVMKNASEHIDTALDIARTLLV
jgi:glyoxylase-like metal-dependent hydrolase (beta-lactamase superfamily II)